MLHEIVSILTRQVSSLCKSSHDNLDCPLTIIVSAPPDRDLVTQQMSGKKKDKFRITLGLACNADGSEMLPLLFIRKYKNPRCFKQKSPEARGLYYRNNTKAWMTKDLFEE
jgi:hypothetical protein